MAHRFVQMPMADHNQVRVVKNRFPAVGYAATFSAADGPLSRSSFSISLTRLSPHLSTDSHNVRTYWNGLHCFEEFTCLMKPAPNSFLETGTKF
jgi:hypothetical protein